MISGKKPAQNRSELGDRDPCQDSIDTTITDSLRARTFITSGETAETIDYSPMTKNRDDFGFLYVDGENNTNLAFHELINDLSRGAYVIELGCGHGSLMKKSYRDSTHTGIHFYGIDKDIDHTVSNKCYIHADNDNTLQFIEADMTDTTNSAIPENLHGNAALVVSQYAMQYTDNPFAGLETANTLLKDGGKAILHCGFREQYDPWIIKELVDANPQLSYYSEPVDTNAYSLNTGQRAGSETLNALIICFDKFEGTLTIPSFTTQRRTPTGDTMIAHQEKMARYIGAA